MKNAASYIAKLGLSGCCIFFAPLVSSAQTRGKVEVVKDPLIDTFIARRPQLNKTPGAGESTSSGYRVQIYFGSNRQSAYSAQAKFMSDYPDVPTYVTYTEPNFKVQVGDFRTRLEAQKLQSDLKGMFSTLFIIPTKINPPKPDASND
ncbi:SPOR domain-containing protein [Mucilaginibacter gotjawali]|uniref:SPOR domain-containing protein n=1 Tax=Mucilaginibacter gotjawali TaxID=1550579 RepID=A0A839SAY4_9SPHI|nr:SPOR domain-containing protein [Mucilaginibacter gotjawali]MBB3054524.1 hypothetical protein [Mucilaginibacter gotjawali]